MYAEVRSLSAKVVAAVGLGQGVQFGVPGGGECLGDGGVVTADRGDEERRRAGCAEGQ